ncbi:SigB/SigF/SigG family RNA polymerase sigma factor [Streptomyces luteolus]|uniref:SigB/SigF/SigG family RNA polymerase sigma factor n=1 Tax=Streptomyces luteolus TaxID=3043615 RepID=A0ABT6SVD1_9ACTN|nr:SigB/SigF/SigG family RNA polymerase sigma factor [Streptomyces sp. B-S-A12]MDI3419568.1 SigB/SigF/SigG family RNA polymerase sigma factor [Streptomyces sp. B-S-A12]
MATQVSHTSTPTAPHAERHTAGPGSPAELPGRHDLPSPSDTARLPAEEIRRLSKTLFARLDELEEGTEAHAYVRNSLVELNLNLVHYAARRMRPQAESWDDVIQVGTIGLIKAINRFELHRGVEFPSYALPTVMGEIKRFFRDTSWSVRVPRPLQELHFDLARATTALEQAHGHPPTRAQLAAHLGRTEAEVAEGQAVARSYLPASLDLPVDGADSDDTLADHLGYHDPDLARVEAVHVLKPLIAALPERERRILALRFVGDRTQREIGEELDISQMHVSRILTRTLGRLRAELDTKR